LAGSFNLATSASSEGLGSGETIYEGSHRFAAPWQTSGDSGRCCLDGEIEDGSSPHDG
jgi:hypothetical protein